MTKRGYISPSKDYLHSHAHTLLLSFSLPLGNLPLSGLQALTRLMPPPQFPRVFWDPKTVFQLSFSFRLKIIKSDSRPDPGALTGFPSRGCSSQAVLSFPYLHCNLSLSCSLFFSAGPRSRSRPGPSCIVHLPALLPSHDVLTCYASASPRAYAYRSASDRSEAAQHYRGRNSNPVAKQA